MMGLLQTAAAQTASKITPEFIEGKLHLTEKQKPQLKRIVLGGLKVMFSKESHHLMLAELDGPGTIAEKIGKGVAGLLALLMHESTNSLPPDLLNSAGMVLVAYAAQWLNKAGTPVSDQDIGGAIDTMTAAVLHAGGVDPSKLAEAGGRPAKPAAQPEKVMS